MGDTTNIRLGTCKITWNAVDLGLTIGGVEVEVATTTHETKVDQYGETVVAEVITGRNITVKCPLAETTLANLVAIMPGATLLSTGAERVDVTVAAGTSLLGLAQELVLHPIALLDADKSEDIIIPKAGTAGAMSFAYKSNEERVYNVEFKGYPDSNDILFKYGDPAAT